MKRTATHYAQRAARRAHGSPEWYTPPRILACVKQFYGPFYFDPCPASFGIPERDGLAIPWRGRVWVNPPYGAAIPPWIHKALREPTEELLLLVPASTEARWFEPLHRFPICFVAGRVWFISGATGKAERPAPHPSVIVYRGTRVKRFADCFDGLGPIVRPYRARRGLQLSLPWDGGEP